MLGFRSDGLYQEEAGPQDGPLCPAWHSRWHTGRRERGNNRPDPPEARARRDRDGQWYRGTLDLGARVQGHERAWAWKGEPVPDHDDGSEHGGRATRYRARRHGSQPVSCPRLRHGGGGDRGGAGADPAGRRRRGDSRLLGSPDHAPLYGWLLRDKG